MQFKLFSIAFISAVLLCSSCQHLKYSPTMSSRDRSGTPSKENAAQRQARAENARSYTPEQEEAVLFVQRHSDATTVLDKTDQDFLDNIVQPAPGSPEEAALTLGIIKEVLGETYANSESNFVESDTQAEPKPSERQKNPTRTTKPSLEQISETRNIDLAAALENNLLLRSNDISNLALEALENSQNTPEFNNSIRSILGRRVAVWQQLENKVDVRSDAPKLKNLNSEPTEFETAEDLAPADTNPAANDPSNSTQQNAMTEENAEPLYLSPDDQDLAAIQRLIDEGETNLALKKLRQIPKSSPMYAGARSKLKQISQQHVRELRAKAAQAYQNALPVADRDLKITYLEEARKYLEQALKTYGDSDDSDTIRSNLSLITDEIEQLKDGDKTF